MNYSQYKKRAKHYLRKQLSLTHYIDVEKAEENIRKNIRDFFAFAADFSTRFFV